MNLWVSTRDGKVEAVAVTQVMVWPGRKLCGIPFVGGRHRRNWLKFEADIIEFARSQGCVDRDGRVLLEGYDTRGGAWLRTLKGTGWEPGYIQMRKAV
jgi:hypothetical protein